MSRHQSQRLQPGAARESLLSLTYLHEGSMSSTGMTMAKTSLMKLLRNSKLYSTDLAVLTCLP